MARTTTIRVVILEQRLAVFCYPDFRCMLRRSLFCNMDMDIFQGLILVRPK
jgi:hypothetical protein